MAHSHAFSIRYNWLTAIRPALLLLPAAVVLLAFFLIPLLRLIVQSLLAESSFSLINYWLILADPLYRISLWNSLWLSVAITLISLVLCTPIAFFLARTKSSFRQLARAGLLFPLSFPGIVVGFMIILLFGNTGLVPALARLSPARSGSPSPIS